MDRDETAEGPPIRWIRVCLHDPHDAVRSQVPRHVYTIALLRDRPSPGQFTARIDSSVDLGGGALAGSIGRSEAEALSRLEADLRERHPDLVIAWREAPAKTERGRSN